VGLRHGTLFIVTIRDLRRIAEKAGFVTVIIRNFNYPVDAIPKAARSLAVLQIDRQHPNFGVASGETLVF